MGTATNESIDQPSLKFLLLNKISVFKILGIFFITST